MFLFVGQLSPAESWNESCMSFWAWSMSLKHKNKKLIKNSWDLTGLTWKERKGRKYEINRWTRRGKMILKNGEYRPKNDFYFCYIFHVSKIVSFCLRAEKPSLDWSAVKRFPRILPKADAWECKSPRYLKQTILWLCIDNNLSYYHVSDKRYCWKLVTNISNLSPTYTHLQHPSKTLMLPFLTLTWIVTKRSKTRHD